MNAGAVRFDRGIALLDRLERKLAAEQRRARSLRQLAIGVVGEGDDAFRVAHHDQVALGFEQAAGALLGFLQFPIAVGHRLVMQRELAEPPVMNRSRMLSVARATQATANRKLAPIAKALGS